MLIYSIPGQAGGKESATVRSSGKQIWASIERGRSWIYCDSLLWGPRSPKQGLLKGSGEGKVSPGSLSGARHLSLATSQRKQTGKSMLMRGLYVKLPYLTCVPALRSRLEQHHSCQQNSQPKRSLSLRQLDRATQGGEALKIKDTIIGPRSRNCENLRSIFPSLLRCELECFPEDDHWHFLWLSGCFSFTMNVAAASWAVSDLCCG